MWSVTLGLVVEIDKAGSPSAQRTREPDRSHLLRRAEVDRVRGGPWEVDDLGPVEREREPLFIGLGNRTEFLKTDPEGKQS